MAVDMKDCPPYLREYIFYLRVIRNRSEKLSNRIISTCGFSQIYQGKYNIRRKLRHNSRCTLSAVAGITLADVYEYLNFSAEERGNNDKTRARKISAIKGFYKALCNNKLTSFHLENNPVEQLDVPSPKRLNPNIWVWTRAESCWKT